jgi:hypothetical protein
MTKGPTSVPIFQEFLAAADRHLAFLVRDFGFKRLPHAVNPPECATTYTTGRAHVSVLYEYLSSPWIQVSQKLSSGRWQEVALESLSPRAKKLVFKDPAKPVGFDALLQAKAKELRPLLPTLLEGRLEATTGIAKEKKRIFQEALVALDQLESSVKGVPMEVSDQRYLNALRTALASGRPSALLTLLDADEQPKHVFSPSLSTRQSFRRRIRGLTVAVQYCLQ